MEMVVEYTRILCQNVEDVLVDTLVTFFPKILRILQDIEVKSFAGNVGLWRHLRMFILFCCADTFAAHDILLVIATYKSTVIMSR